MKDTIIKVTANIHQCNINVDHLSAEFESLRRAVVRAGKQAAIYLWPQTSHTCSISLPPFLNILGSQRPGWILMYWVNQGSVVM
jgi:hypothetical protein